MGLQLIRVKLLSNTLEIGSMILETSELLSEDTLIGTSSVQNWFLTTSTTTLAHLLT